MEGGERDWKETKGGEEETETEKQRRAEIQWHKEMDEQLENTSDPTNQLSSYRLNNVRGLCVDTCINLWVLYARLFVLVQVIIEFACVYCIHVHSMLHSGCVACDFLCVHICPHGSQACSEIKTSLIGFKNQKLKLFTWKLMKFNTK